MKVFLIRSLLFISAVSLLAGCSIRNYGLENLKTGDFSTLNELPVIYTDTFSTILFKTQVDLYGKYFGGLLLVKKIIADHYRLVMTTETGIQIFDFELNKDSLRVISCMDKLNKKAVIQVIENDFRLLLYPETMNHTPKLLTNSSNSHQVYKFTKGKKRTYYFIENKTGYLDRIEQASPWFKKVSMVTEKNEIGKTTSVIIQHYNARLKIKLKLLKIS